MILYIYTHNIHPSIHPSIYISINFGCFMVCSEMPSCIGQSGPTGLRPYVSVERVTFWQQAALEFRDSGGQDMQNADSDFGPNFWKAPGDLKPGLRESSHVLIGGCHPLLQLDQTGLNLLVLTHTHTILQTHV